MVSPLWSAEDFSVVKKRARRSDTLGPLLSLSRKRKWLPSGYLAEKFSSKAGPRLLLLYPLNAFLLNYLPFKEDQESAYVSACIFRFERAPVLSAEVDSDIWYGHQGAVPGPGVTPVLTPFSVYSTFPKGLPECSYAWRTAYSFFTLVKCLLLSLQMGNKGGSTLKSVSCL